MKKLKSSFPILIVLILVLASCQRAQPTGQPMEPSATILATSTVVQTATAYPAPGMNLTPSASSQPLLLPEVVSQGTLAAEVTATMEATLMGTSSVSPYPGPDNQLTQPTVETAEPYPGPGQIAGPSPQTPLSGAPTATFAQGLLTPVTGTPLAATLTPTITPTPGLIQTELRATNPENFTLASGSTQLVEFFAFWSPTSKSMAPVMHVLEERYQDQIRFSYLDVDDPANSLYKMLLGDRLPPVFFVLDGQGSVVAEFQGYVKPEEFEAAFVLQPVQPTIAPPPTP